jgi:hypothetical protein
MSSVDFLQGMDYGFGFNVLEGKTRGSGVKGSSPWDLPGLQTVINMEKLQFRQLINRD